MLSSHSEVESEASSAWDYWHYSSLDSIAHFPFSSILESSEVATTGEEEQPALEPFTSQARGSSASNTSPNTHESPPVSPTPTPSSSCSNSPPPSLLQSVRARPSRIPCPRTGPPSFEPQTQTSTVASPPATPSTPSSSSSRGGSPSTPRISNRESFPLRPARRVPYPPGVTQTTPSPSPPSPISAPSTPLPPPRAPASSERRTDTPAPFANVPSTSTSASTPLPTPLSTSTSTPASASTPPSTSTPPPNVNNLSPGAGADLETPPPQYLPLQSIPLRSEMQFIEAKHIWKFDQDLCECGENWQTMRLSARVLHVLVYCPKNRMRDEAGVYMILNMKGRFPDNAPFPTRRTW